MKKLTLILLCQLLLIGIVHAQTRVLKGTVTAAEDGTSIPGVSVSVEGTTLGTITDMDGHYLLKIPENAKTLVFSFVGMATKKVTIEEKSEINVKLSPSNIAVDQVVVTALGISRKKKALGYAVQEIDGDDLTKAKDDNVVNTLSGKISGVQVTAANGALGSSSRITIRGNSSFTSNEPLFVVDGIPISNYQSSVGQYGGVDFGNGISDLDPSNIKSITVLKGANAAALYGMEAANGVILITTKNGKGGNSFQVNVNASITFSDAYLIPHYQNKYGQGYDGSEYIYNNSGSSLSYQDYSTSTSFSYVDGNGSGVHDGLDESWGPRMDIGLEIPQFDSPIVDGEYQPTDWVSHPNNVKDFFRTGISYDDNVSVQASSENSSGRLFLSRQDLKGTLPNTAMTKTSASLSGTLTSPAKKFIAKGNVSYTQTKSDNLPGQGYSSGNVMQSIGSWFGRQVNMASLKANWQTTNQDGNPYNWNTNYHNNPYWTLYKDTNAMQKDHMIGNASLTYKLTNWVSVMGRVGMDWYHLFEKRVSADGSIDTSDGGAFSQSQKNHTQFNADLIFTFNKDINKEIGFNGTLGANYQDRQQHYMYYEATSLTVPDLYSITNVSGTPSVDQDDEQSRSNSVFGSASFDYKKWLYLDLTGRNDWSSTLAEGNWSFFYPSVTLSWLPTEAFAQLKSNTLSFLKIRGSWAKVGNATDPYQLTQVYTAKDSYDGVTPYRLPTTMPPTNLKPETIISTEFGFELKLFKSRLGLNATYYKKVTKDQIMKIDISDASGYDNMMTNAGEIQNSGIELELHADILKPHSKNGFNWSMDINWAKNKNRVNDLYSGISTYQISSSWSSLTIDAIKGEKFGVMKGYGFAKDDNGAIIVDSDGLPEASDNPEEIGNIMPDWTGGINNSFTWKNFSASFLLDMRMGGDIFSVTDWFGAQAGTSRETAQMASRSDAKGENIREAGLVVGKDVLKQYKAVDEDGNENNTVVSAQDYYESYWNTEKQSIIKGSFVKLREITFGYSIPKPFLQKIGFLTKAQVSFVGRNIALLWKDKSNDIGIDPETAMGTTLAGMGIEQYQIPATRNLGFKVSLTF